MKTEIKQRITQLNNGEIPDGYEKTEFGVFPADWVKDKPFGDLFEFYGGLGKTRDDLGAEGHAYLHYGDMHRGSFNHVSYGEYMKLPKCDVALKGDENYLMNDGDIAFLDASEDLEGTSRAVLIDNPDNEPFIAGLHVIYAKSKDDSLEKWFKQYITLGESVKKQFQKLSVGFKVYGLNRYTLPRINFSYPADKAEQSKIAEILMKWDEAIELQNNLLEKLYIQKKTLLRVIFSNLSNCSKAILDQITTKEKGAVVNTSAEGDYPVIDMEYFTTGMFLNFTDDYKVFAEENDILLLWDGAGAGNLITGVSGVVGSTFVKITSKNIQSRYLYYYLLNQQSKYSLLREGSGIPHMHKDFFRRQVVEYPNEKEQTCIVNVLSSVDGKIKSQENLIKRLQLQRQILQQYLLNGIVRVK